MTDDRMRGITVRQPWASLIAGGVKTIETRSRRTSYRGPVAIHAAQAMKPFHGGCWHLTEYAHGHWHLWSTRPERSLIAHRSAIVALAEVVDCLPIVENSFTKHDHQRFILRDVGGLGREVLRLAERAPEPGPGIHSYAFGCGASLTADYTDELRFGDYRTGRWGLLLDNVRPLAEPVPAKGQQAVPWYVPEDVATKVREQLAVTQ